MKNRPVIVTCHENRIFTFLNFLVVFTVILLVIGIVYINYRGIQPHWIVNTMLFPFFIIGSIWGLINLIYTSPTFWLHEEGITVIFPFRKIFVGWEEIVEVRQAFLATDIVFQRLTFFNRLVGFSLLRRYPMIRLTSMKNRKIFIKLVEAKIPNRLK